MSHAARAGLVTCHWLKLHVHTVGRTFDSSGFTRASTTPATPIAAWTGRFWYGTPSTLTTWQLWEINTHGRLTEKAERASRRSLRPVPAGGALAWPTHLGVRGALSRHPTWFRTACTSLISATDLIRRGTNCGSRHTDERCSRAEPALHDVEASGCRIHR